LRQQQLPMHERDRLRKWHLHDHAGKRLWDELQSAVSRGTDRRFGDMPRHDVHGVVQWSHSLQ
jgi:hypothetical protein